MTVTILFDNNPRTFTRPDNDQYVYDSMIYSLERIIENRHHAAYVTVKLDHLKSLARRLDNMERTT